MSLTEAKNKFDSLSLTDYTVQGKFEASLNRVLNGDRLSLIKSRKNYGESWCKRGGVGAFMMFARKWDRMENYLTTTMRSMGKEYDVFEAMRTDGRAEGIIDDIRDLRRYLALAEAKMIEDGTIHDEVKKDVPNEDETKLGIEPIDVDDTPDAAALHPH